MGFRPNRPRLSQALLLLFRLANRRAEPPAARNEKVVEEIVWLRRAGYRFIALADDNFYPVSLTDIALAENQNNPARLAELQSLRADRFDLMKRLAQLPEDMVFYTQITMEAGEDGVSWTPCAPQEFAAHWSVSSP